MKKYPILKIILRFADFHCYA